MGELRARGPTSRHRPGPTRAHPFQRAPYTTLILQGGPWEKLLHGWLCLGNEFHCVLLLARVLLSTLKPLRSPADKRDTEEGLSTPKDWDSLGPLWEITGRTMRKGSSSTPLWSVQVSTCYKLI